MLAGPRGSGRPPTLTQSSEVMRPPLQGGTREVLRPGQGCETLIAATHRRLSIPSAHAGRGEAGGQVEAREDVAEGVRRQRGRRAPRLLLS